MEYELRLWQTISDWKNVIPFSIHPYVGVVDIVRSVLCITFGAQSICWSGWWAELWDSGIGILAVAVTSPGIFSFFNLRTPVARPEALHDGAISAVFNVESVESTCYLPVGHSIQRVWNLNRWNQLQPCTPYVLQSLTNHVDIRPADASCARLEFRSLGLACWMDPTGFRIHISINRVARIQASDQSASATLCCRSCST